MIVPKQLQIEVTNHCNADCTYCRRRQVKRRKFHLPLEDFKCWVHSAPYVVWVQPQGIGESLLYPDLIEALSYAKAQGHKTMFYTNASLLTREYTELLLEVEVDELTFSVDGYNSYTFSTRRGLSWKKVYLNIKRFQHYRNKGGYATHTKVRGTITDRNKYHMLHYRLFWRDIVDEVTMMPYVEFPDPHLLDHTPYAQGKGFQCYHIFNVKPRSPRLKSVTPIITVLNNGDVVICCQDWFSDYVMGNLYESTPLEVFNNELYDQVRDGMQSGVRYPLLCEYCRLGKMGKRHLVKPSTLFWRGINKVNSMLEAS